MGLLGFITIYMATTDHKGFVTFLQTQDCVLEAHLTSGGGCFMLKVVVQGTEQLNKFLELMLKYAQYGISLSIDKVKG